MRLTPGVGLMTTVGGSLEFAAPPFGLDAPPIDPKRSGMAPGCEAEDNPDGWFGIVGSPPEPPALRGLFLMSLSVEVDEEGVKTGDWVEPSRAGDAVPSLESLFFLEDLLGSLPRESCKEISLAMAKGGTDNVLGAHPGNRGMVLGVGGKADGHLPLFD